jgi:molybdopterin molybdotransferase
MTPRDTGRPVTPRDTGRPVTPRDVSWHRARAIAAGAEPLPPVRVSLADALGLVLATGIKAPAALPPADTAAMDGFAIRGEGPWRIVGALRAGQARTAAINPGEAVEIATGAAVPPATDAVLRYEDAGRAAPGEITGRCEPGRHIRRTGGDVSAGETLITAGTRLSALMLGLAASAGLDEVTVRPRPRIAVTITGAEIRAAGLPSPQVTRDALGPAITGLAAALGGHVTRMRYAADGEQRLAAALADDDVDLHVVTGGSSCGPADLLHKVLAGAGAELLVDGVRCRPGHPQLLAALPCGRRVVGLPGNPFAAVAALLTLLAPLLTALSGAAQAPETTVPRPPGAPRRAGLTVLVPARQDEHGRIHLQPSSSPASLRSVAHATHLLAITDSQRATLIPLPTGLVS